MAEFNISGRLTVKSLKKQFKEAFGATLRVYKGKQFADDDATLASIRVGDVKGGELKCAGNLKVGNFENKMKELFGVTESFFELFLQTFDRQTAANVEFCHF